MIWGTGLEIGALASPFPAPIHCNVIYADLLSYEELIEECPKEPVETLVQPALRVQFDSLDHVLPGSLDFLIASHVVEHTRNPIGAIVRAYEKLRTGGHLVLVIPDKRRTFDRERRITDNAHLVADFHDPSHERDREHHQEYYEKAFPRSAQSDDSVWLRSWEERWPIHYHTWVYETFAELIDWIIKNAAPFSSVWSHPTLPREIDDFEFYFTLRK